LLAKSVAIVAIALPVTAVANAAGFIAGQRVLGSEHANATLASPGAIRAIVFGAVAVTLVGLVGVALGELLRRTATATMVLSVGVVGTQIVAGVLPSGAQRYLPSPAIEAAVTTNPGRDLLTPGAALLVLAVYALVVLGPALALVNRRDP
jgi:ABC-2 type transport system permease protein